jgi:hypothetical protein
LAARACPTVTVLATSRVPLELPAEEVFAIPPMGDAGLPSDPFERYATALFLDRTTSIAGAYALTSTMPKRSAKSVTFSMACRSRSSSPRAGFPSCHRATCSIISGKASPPWPRTPRSSRSVIVALR